MSEVEYKVVEISEVYLGDCHSLEAILNNYGMEGWKLCSVIGCKYVFMKEKNYD